MAGSTVRFHRTGSGGSPAALVAAWLIDALAGLDNVSLMCSDTDLIMLDVTPLDASASVHDIVGHALAESRFAGWQVLSE